MTNHADSGILQLSECDRKIDDDHKTIFRILGFVGHSAERLVYFSNFEEAYSYLNKQRAEYIYYWNFENDKQQRASIPRRMPVLRSFDICHAIQTRFAVIANLYEIFTREMLESVTL